MERYPKRFVEDSLGAALKDLAKTVLDLAVEMKDPPILGRLAGALMISGDLLAEWLEEKDAAIRESLPRFLKRLEKICAGLLVRVDGCQVLQDMAETSPGSEEYKAFETRLRNAFQQARPQLHRLVEEIITFSNIAPRKEASLARPIIQATDALANGYDGLLYLTQVNALYDVLRAYSSCTCPKEFPYSRLETRHMSRLLLRPLAWSSDGRIRFSMLFSSDPRVQDSSDKTWRDIRLVMERQRPAKQVKFVENSSQVQPHPELKYVRPKDFCGILRSQDNHGVQVSFLIQQTLLHRMQPPEGPQPSRRIQHDAGVSLARLLQRTKFASKEKVFLAYVLAKSFWQYHDSNWMTLPWNRDKIYFMFERGKDFNDAGYVPTRPYFEVRFDQHNENNDISMARMTWNQQLRSLGILLVEITIGRTLESDDEEYQQLNQTGRTNLEWREARDLACMPDAADEDLVESLLRDIARFCLDPPMTAGLPEASGSKVTRSHEIMYINVVERLEKLLKCYDYDEEDLERVGPFKNWNKNNPLLKSSTAGKVKQTEQIDVTNGHGHEAREYLARINALNDKMFFSTDARIESRSKRIRIAILDTGFDDSSLFFDNPERRNRITSFDSKWKDFVERQSQPRDDDGHGTYIVSLVMQMAPFADIYVARVARNEADLADAGHLVAEAITWAKTRRADIICMAFGFEDDVSSVSEAIYSCLNNKGDSTLFFAAAANHGANSRELFPARHDCVISIRGTDHLGTFQSFNPPRNHQESIVYGTLGKHVPSACTGPMADSVTKSGTSVATAIAVGIAAILIQYAICHRIRELNQIDLRERSVMLEVFYQLGRDTLNTGYRYLQPWRLDDKDAEKRLNFFKTLCINYGI